MGYYDLRSMVAQIVPRMTQLFSQTREQGAVREKGRKGGYKEFKLDRQEWVPQERLLNTEEINSFAEISVRAAACPMPLNLDVWDGLLCPYGCRYCFANAFRASLYTAFFDNSKTMGLRHCNPDKYKRELDKLLKQRGRDPHDVKGDVAKAIAMEVPIRFGIRFEDFCGPEAREGISLELLNYLADHSYPLMINTKSALVGTDPYVEALARNKGKTAVHVTLITSDANLLRTLEPGAPSYRRRMKAMATLAAAGVRVVARIEPFLPFLCDRPEDFKRYSADLKAAGVRNITFDTYSYSANNPGIRQDFLNHGIDWERIFTVGCDSQGLGSLLLGEYMAMWREAGFSCSTFDMGNAPSNDQAICCEVGDWFEGGWNHGCSVMAVRFIQDAGKPVSWSDFKEYVDEHGGFLSPSLELDVHQLWNVEGNNAYSPSWGQGIVPVGWDRDGVIWKYKPNDDFRKDLLAGLEG
jgi:DNA repair photolyase